MDVLGSLSQFILMTTLWGLFIMTILQMKALGCREIKHFCSGSPLPSFVAESLAYLLHPQLQHITLGLSDGPCILYSHVCEFPHLDAFHSHSWYALVKASLAGKTSEITFLGNPFPYSLRESITPHSPWQFAHFIWLIYSCICLCDYISLLEELFVFIAYPSIWHAIYWSLLS